ncbi:Ovate protein family, C-terminal [Artemisia annua]|uniref:Transcription repressor n=1 Tax=Artemisia annua TaxID=35608 RepID=A0A2U1KUP7_ARTAN|nr:Ovate protein family, C-terminal [Artemisia annua]
MGRKLPFLPTCGSPSKTLSFRAVMTASAITDDLDDKGMTQETESSIESMESIDPYVDFKKSMQEMVEADEGLKQWDNLQELLSMYLSLNDKINHGYIIRAFVDILLVNLVVDDPKKLPGKHVLALEANLRFVFTKGSSEYRVCKAGAKHKCGESVVAEVDELRELHNRSKPLPLNSSGFKTDEVGYDGSIITCMFVFKAIFMPSVLFESIHKVLPNWARE